MTILSAIESTSSICTGITNYNALRNSGTYAGDMLWNVLIYPSL